MLHPFYHSRPTPAALVAAGLRDALCAVAAVATIIMLCTAFEPGPQISSFRKTHIACAKPAGDPIGALILAQEGR